MMSFQRWICKRRDLIIMMRWKSNVRYAADAKKTNRSFFLFFFFLVKNIVRVFSRLILSIVYPSSGTRMNFRGHFSFFQPLMHSCLSRIWKTSRLFAFRGELRGEISIFFFFFFSIFQERVVQREKFVRFF